jgi:hypothetical protein
MEYAGDSNPAYIAGPYTVSGEGGSDDLFIASYYDDTPQNPFVDSFSVSTPGTYSVVFPSPLVSRAFTVTHSGSSTYHISQILPRKLVQKYDIEANSIKAYHVSSTLIDTIALQVSDSIVVGSGLIGEKSIDGAKIVDGTISGVLIANGTVTGNKVQAGTISGVLIAGATITGDNIQAATISGSLISAGTITFDKIASKTLTASQIADATITGSNIVAGTVSGVLITDNAVSASKIQANTITGDKIVAGTISGVLIAAGTITADNITTRTITADKIVLSGITADLLGVEAVTAAALASGAVISGKLAVGAVQTNNLAAGSVTAYAIAANTITGDKIAANTISGALITAQTITADRIASSTLTAAQIADGTITGQKIVAGTVSGVLITDNAITASKIQANTITGDKIVANTISGSLITAATISGSLIAANTITANKLSVSQLDAVAGNMGTLVVNSGISVGANGTITAGRTKIDTNGMSVGSLANPLTQTSLPGLNSNVLTIVASGTSGDLQGIAMFNVVQSTATPQASINLDGTTTLEIANNVESDDASVHVNFKNSYTGALRIYNGNLDLRRIPDTVSNLPPGAIRGYADTDGPEVVIYELSRDRINLSSYAGATIFNVEATTGATTINGDTTVSGYFTHFNVGGIYRSTTQNIAAGVRTQVLHNTADAGSYLHNLATSSITIPGAGFYLIDARGATTQLGIYWTVRSGSTAWNNGTQVLGNFSQTDYREMNSIIWYSSGATNLRMYFENTSANTAAVYGHLRVVRLV